MEKHTDSASEFIVRLAQCERKLAGYVMSLVPIVADADEILQETKIQLWGEFGNYDPTKSFEAWALTLAYYQVRSYRKRCSRSKLVFSNETLELLSDEFKSRDMGGRSDSARSDAFRQCLDKLTSKARDVVMEYYSGVSVARIGKSIGISGEGIRKLIYRARISLHDCVNRAMSLHSEGRQ